MKRVESALPAEVVYDTSHGTTTRAEKALARLSKMNTVVYVVWAAGV
jgi:hypothetical protein